MRKIPFVGTVATKADFDKLERETQDQIEEFQESADRLIKRRLEDIGYQDMAATPNLGLSDVAPLKRREIVRRAVRYWNEDPIVGEAIDHYTNYVFGRGLPVPRMEHRGAQEVLDKFWNDDDNKLVLTSTEAQHQKSAELQLQGNVWLTIFPDESTGTVKLSDLLDGEVQDIIVHPANRKKHLWYKRVIKPVKYDFKNHQYAAVTDTPDNQPKIEYHADWKNLPLSDDDNYSDMNEVPAEMKGAGLVYHISINRLSDGKFGNPRIRRVLDWARAYNQFMKARVSLMEAAAWLAWRQKTRGDASVVRKQSADFVSQRFAAAGVTGDGNPAPPPPRYAATITENENSTMEFVKTDTGSANAKNDGQMLKAQIGAGVGFPIHYFGDSSGGANLATATAMELPVLKMCEAAQEYWEGVFKNIVDCVIATAIKAGNLPKPKKGKFSDIEGGSPVSGTFRENGYSDSFIADLVEKYPEHMVEAGTTPDVSMPDMSMEDATGDDIYAYHLALPSIIQRQLSETINAVVNMLKALDPNGTNDEMARWAFDYCLVTLNVTNAPDVMERVFPKGKAINRWENPAAPVMDTGGAVPNRGDGRIIDNKPKRPDAKTTTGGPTRAWTPEDHAAAKATKEAASEPLDSTNMAEIQAEFDHQVRTVMETLTDEFIAEIAPGVDNA